VRGRRPGHGDDRREAVLTAAADEAVLAQSGADGHRPGGSRRGAGAKVSPSLAPGDHGDVADGATHLAGGADALLRPSPFVGFGLRDALGGLRFLAAQVARQPRLPLDGLPRTAVELFTIGLGRSQLEPANAGKRFRDPAWSESRFLRSAMQVDLQFGSELDSFAERSGTKTAPTAVGSERFPAKEPAPGTYVFQ
jgi:hypothetical protein